MFARVARSWELTKQSGRVLLEDKRLVVLPLLSTAACLVVLASFAVPLVLSVDWEALENAKAADRNSDPALGPVQWLLVFLMYFVMFFVIAFFNAALVACAIDRFNGEQVSVKRGLATASSRLPQILGWAAVAATVGVVLQMIAERLGLIGKIVIRLLGMAWAIATFFVVPVLVVEKVGPIDAVKRSTAIIRKMWGETLVANVGVSAVAGVAALLASLPMIGGIVAAAMEGPIWLLIAGILTSLLLWMAIALISSTLKVIILAALYRYAATGLIPEHFDGAMLKQTFKPKKQK